MTEAEVTEVRHRVLTKDGKVRPGFTMLPNSVIARLLEGFGDCAVCPVLAEGVHMQLERAQQLELNLRGIGEWLTVT